VRRTLVVGGVLAGVTTGAVYAGGLVPSEYDGRTVSNDLTETASSARTSRLCKYKSCIAGVSLLTAEGVLYCPPGNMVLRVSTSGGRGGRRGEGGVMCS
jgi:hypothetical protein